MEEKTQSPQNSQEDIKLLTFQPQYMVDAINKLKDEVSSLNIEINTLNMFIIYLMDENSKLHQRSLKSRLQELLLRCLGGQWEEGKK